jgi:hypothetical protein
MTHTLFRSMSGRAERWSARPVLTNRTCKEDSMAANPLPDQETLLKLLRYEPETGKLYWLERSIEMFSHCKQGAVRHCRAWNTKNAGNEAFTAISEYGHLRGCINRQFVHAHRVAWKMAYGEDPIWIDHIDHNPQNNRLSNLRSVTHKENMRNGRLRRTNKSGQTGVCFNERDNRWVAGIVVDGRTIGLGYYRKKSDAVSARLEAEVRYGFHPNHGNQT